MQVSAVACAPVPVARRVIAQFGWYLAIASVPAFEGPGNRHVGSCIPAERALDQKASPSCLRNGPEQFIETRQNSRSLRGRYFFMPQKTATVTNVPG